jgi:hypothetical protein
VPTAAVVLDTIELTPEAVARALLLRSKPESYIRVNDEPLP